MENKNRIENGVIIASVDGTLFSNKSVLNCTYWFGDKFHISINKGVGMHYTITLCPLPNSNISESELPYFLQKLERDLIDFRLRDIVNAETHNIRELLIAKAFSNGEYEEEPPGEITDPIGFAPLT